MDTLKIKKLQEGVFKHVVNDVEDQSLYLTTYVKLSIYNGTIAINSGTFNRDFYLGGVELYDINSTTPLLVIDMDDFVKKLAGLGYPLLGNPNFSNSGGGSGTTVDKELVVTTYSVKTAFTGASIGDTITATQVIDVTGTPSTVSTIWRNQTTGVDLASAPSAANLTLLGSQALTDAQLRAAAVVISNQNLQNIDTDLGAISDAAATTDTGSFSVISLFKRALQNWTTLLSRIPTLGQKNMAGSTPVVISSDQSAVPVSGPLTNEQLRESPLPLPTGSATSARQDLILQELQLKADLTEIQPVIPSMTNGGNLMVTTNATGTTFNAFASQACKQLNISNQTGTTIEVRQDGAGVGFQIPTGAFYTFFGITNANKLEIRRVDTSNTQVTVTARWEV